MSIKRLEELMAQADALKTIPVEGSFEWFDDIIPKAQKLLQQIKRELDYSATEIGSSFFNKVRDSCDELDRHIQQLFKIRSDLETQKNNVIKTEMNKMSIHNGAYQTFRGFFGK